MPAPLCQHSRMASEPKLNTDAVAAADPEDAWLRAVTAPVSPAAVAVARDNCLLLLPCSRRWCKAASSAATAALHVSEQEGTRHTGRAVGNQLKPEGIAQSFLKPILGQHRGSTAGTTADTTAYTNGVSVRITALPWVDHKSVACSQTGHPSLFSCRSTAALTLQSWHHRCRCEQHVLSSCRLLPCASYSPANTPQWYSHMQPSRLRQQGVFGICSGCAPCSLPHTLAGTAWRLLVGGRCCLAA